MAPAESDAARERKAADLAYQKGTEDAKIDAHFADHDRHLLDINGSVERMNTSLTQVERRLVEIEKRETSRDAVAAAIAKAVEKHGQAQITTRTFVLGVSGVIVAMGGLFLAASPT